jgi:alpha-tubulin suppressor-like RCC1 family protein
VFGIDGTGAKATDVDAGLDHTCAVLQPGSVWCWGFNPSGQLGDGTTTNQLVPVETSLTAANKDICSFPVGGVPCDAATQVSAGGAHTCAVLVDQTIDCWGDNAFGQLGLGVFGGATSTPTPVHGLPGPALSVSAGDTHTCAVIKNLGVWCWGNGTAGSLGYGGTTSQALPIRVAFSDIGPQPDLVSAGGNSSTCATLSDHSVWCWGFNGNVQVGDGTTTERDVPTRSTMATATALGTGYSHVCVADATENPGIACWGNNGYGALGNNYGSIQSLTPQVLARGGSFSSIDSSPLHSCATDRIAVYCWGDNTHLKLGDPALNGNGVGLPHKVVGL